MSKREMGRKSQAVTLREHGLSFQKIGDQLGCSSSRARQLYFTGLRYQKAEARVTALGWKRILSSRANNCLSQMLDGYDYTPADVAAMNYEEVLAFPNFGQASMDEVEAALAECGLKFAGQDEFKLRKAEQAAKHAAEALPRAEYRLEEAKARYARQAKRFAPTDTHKSGVNETR